MKKALKNIFARGKRSKTLFILDMANNHMGDVKHGLKIIREFSKATKKYRQSDFLFGFKFQFRDIPSFIHPDYKDRLDIKYVKRFSETWLSERQFSTLKKELVRQKFITVCTPFDEPSVDLVEKMNFDILKIASCSFTDWPLLERIAKTERPIIASTAAADINEIDQVVSFLQHRRKVFALMHCVGEYPTEAQNLQLNQINLFRKRYPDVTIGFSTHEDPDNFDAVKIAIAKGAKILEKHAAVKTKKYDINAYSITPEKVTHWLEAAKQTVTMAGVMNRRSHSSAKEISDLSQFKRGVFAKRKVSQGELIKSEDIFSAWPNQPGQILANDLSKYNQLMATTDIAKNAPLTKTKVRAQNIRQNILSAAKKVRNLLDRAKVFLPDRLDFEISHHYGIDKFYKYGMTLITCINREYCKKLLILLAGQKNPAHYHKTKEETFHILYGDFVFNFDGKNVTAKSGEIITVPRKVKHTIFSKSGGILEEVSTTHYVGDSYYVDDKITQNKNRKTYLTFWRKI